MPDLMVAKMRREWIRFPVRKDQRADGVEQPACDEKGNGPHAKLAVNGADQKNNDPAHQQETDIGHQDGNFGEEYGLKCNKEYCQTPNDAEQDPAGGTAKDRQTKGRIRPCNEYINGVVIENAKNTQIFIEQQKEMQEAAKQKRQE